MMPVTLPTVLRVPAVVSSHGGDDSNLPLVLGAVFLIGLGLIYLGWKKWRVSRLVKNTPIQRARSAAVGRTELQGRARDVGLTYEQPYADGECVYRQWQVEEYQKDSDPDDNTREWVMVDSGTDVAPFYVEDDTGRVLVDTTQGPTFEISDENSYTTTVDAGEDPPPEVQSFSTGGSGIVETADAISKVPGLGGVGDALGSGSMVDKMQGGDGGESAESTQQQRKEMMGRYFDEDVLDEDGTVREDISEQELKQAMNEDAMPTGPTDFFEQMRGTNGSGGTEAEPTTTEEEAGDPPHRDGNDEQGTPDEVQELGGTGTAGTLGTGSSLGEAMVQRVLFKLSGGRIGNVGGTFLDSGSSRGSYNRRRYSHEVLPLEEDVHVFGEAQPRDGASGSNAERLKLGEETATGQFIVSDFGEDGLVKGYSRRGPIYIVLGLLVSALCLAGLLMSLGLV